MCRFLVPFAAIAAAMLSGSAAFAQSTSAPPADLHPPLNLDADTLRSRYLNGQLGLKPGQGASSLSERGLPYGIDYNRDAKSLVMPIDEKSEWGVGVGLNMNSSKVIELSPGSALGLQPPTRAPGVMLHKKF